jgi:hypothetical protein
MPLLFVPMVGLLGIAIAMARRSAQASQDFPPADLATRLLRWAAGLLPPDRDEWGRAMLGELDHVDGRLRRLWFALGCVGAALVLPPWGRSAAGAWAMIALEVGSIGAYAGVVIHYGLGGGDWVVAGFLSALVVGFLLAAMSLVRRPGVAVPGLLGGLLVVLITLGLSGFTFYDQIAPDIVPWHPWVETLVAPLMVGAAGTLWSRDAIVGKQAARLAAVVSGLGLYVYWTLAVAAIGAGGPPDDEHTTVQSIVSDRTANSFVLMLVFVTATATVGWAGAAAAGSLANTRVPPRTPAVRVPAAASGQMTATGRDPLTVPEQAGQTVSGRHGGRTARLLLLFALMAGAIVLAAATWLPG